MLDVPSDPMKTRYTLEHAATLIGVREGYLRQMIKCKQLIPAVRGRRGRNGSYYIDHTQVGLLRRLKELADEERETRDYLRSYGGCCKDASDTGPSGVDSKPMAPSPAV